MGTPREYGFNDISNENILKADPLPSFLNFFFFCGPPHSEWPHSASKLFSVGGKEGATTQVEHKPTVLPTRPTRHWPGPMLDSVGTRAWMTLTVPECIGNCRWCWDARALPSPAAPSPRPPPRTLFSPRQSRRASEGIRSWGCCSSRMFSWSLDLWMRQED